MVAINEIRIKVHVTFLQHKHYAGNTLFDIHYTGSVRVALTSNPVEKKSYLNMEYTSYLPFIGVEQ